MNFFRKKYYKEVPCKACEGIGKHERFDSNIGGVPLDFILAYFKLTQGICLACNGCGTQTILDRVE